MRRLSAAFALCLGMCGEPTAAPTSGDSSISPPSTPQTIAVTETKSSEPACELARIHATAEAISRANAAWDPDSGVIPDHAEEAANGVWVACGEALPLELRELLDRLVEHPQLDAAAQGKRAMALFETVCPGVVAEGLGELPGPARSRALFDGCKLGDRSDLLVSRAEFDQMHATPHSVHVLALAAWLSDHGVSASDTRTIGRELFRRASARGRSIELDLLDDTRLPTAESGTRPTEGVLVIVRRTALDAGAHRIVELDAGLVPADSRTGERIDPLYDIFAEEVDKARVLASVTATPRERSVLLAADRDVPWTTLRQVLATASAAGLRRADLLVLVHDSFDPVRALTLQDASRSLDELAVPADATAGDLVRLRIARPRPPCARGAVQATVAPAPHDAKDAARQLARWLADPEMVPKPAPLGATDEVDLFEYCGACEGPPKPRKTKLAGAAAIRTRMSELVAHSPAEVLSVQAEIACKKGCCRFVPDPEFGVYDSVVNLEKVCMTLADGKPVAYTRIDVSGSW